MSRERKPSYRNGVLRGAALALLLLLPGTAVHAQGGAAEGADMLYSLKFNAAPLDIMLDDYSQKTGRTLLMGPKVPKNLITLRSQGPLVLDEYLQAVEAVLAMYGIGLVKVGDKFVKVVPIAEARQEAMAIGEQRFEPVMDDQGKPVTNTIGKIVERFVGLDETDELVSQLITLKHIALPEAKAAIDPIKHPYGQIHLFESMNSLLVTDSASNINRMMKVLQYIDQPVEAREEPHIIAIRHSKASEIKQKLEELIADSQEEARKPVAVRKTAGSPGTELRTPQGVIRARTTTEPATPEPEVTDEVVAQAERGIIRGKVKIVADDRTSILIIITRPENMKYFEKIVEVLDVETSPDVIVRVIRLEFADAKDIATMLNDLIGAAAKEEAPAGPKTAVEPGGSTALREVKTVVPSKASPQLASKVGELSKDNIKILADERTNALILMASKSDLEAMEAIIKDMDMMLSQVMVEAVVLEVNLGDTLETGFDWLQRSIIAYSEDGLGRRTPIASFANTGGGGDIAPSDSLSFTDVGKFPSDPLSGLTSYLTFFDLNLDMVLRMVATDSRTKILSSPVILTTDNKPATINVSTERYFFKGKRLLSNTGNTPLYEDDVETKPVGISLTVTPRINAKKFVVMEIEQSIDNVSGVQSINGTDWPVVTKRKLEADIAVSSGETIVLGGLVLNQTVNSESGIPFLSRIPLLGRLFKSNRDERNRNEVIVFITPYVMNTPEEIARDALRRASSVHTGDMWQRGWSNSKLATPTDAERKAAVADAKAAKRLRKEAEKEAEKEAAKEARRQPQAPPARALTGLHPEIADFVSQENEHWDKVLDKVDREIEQDAGVPGVTEK